MAQLDRACALNLNFRVRAPVRLWFFSHTGHSRCLAVVLQCGNINARHLGCPVWWRKSQPEHELLFFAFLELNKRRKKGCTESRNLIIGECRRLRRISYYVRNFFPFMHLVEGVSVLADFKSWFLFVCAYVRDFWALGARTRWNVSTYSTAHRTKVTNRFPL